MTAAKELADATAKMVEAAKSCASKPQDPDSQDALKRAAENLRITTQSAVGTTIKRKMIKRLENASKHAAATATQCIAASQGAGGHNTNSITQDELMDSCKAVADVIPRLVEGNFFLLLWNIQFWLSHPFEIRGLCYMKCST